MIDERLAGLDARAFVEERLLGLLAAGWVWALAERATIAPPG